MRRKPALNAFDVTFADRMPEASSTPAVDGDAPGTKKAPTR